MRARAAARVPWPAALAGLWAVAAAARLALLDGPLAVGEAAWYAVSRGWGADPANVVPAYTLNGALWWQRPLFSILLWPGAALGPVAYRAEAALLAALLSPLAAEAARKAGAPLPLAVGAGLALAVHPSLVLWGARAAPGPLMAVLALAGLRAHQAGRPLAAGALLLAAAWTEEAAAVPCAALLARAAWAAWRRGEARPWPLELDRAGTAFLGATLLAPLPLAVSVFLHGGRLLGWPEAAGLSWADAAPLLWLALPAAAGLAWRGSRGWGLLAFGTGAAWAGLAAAGRGMEASALALPAALAAVAAALALGAAARHAAAGVRRAGRAGAAAVALAVVALAVLPQGMAAKAVAAPGAPPPSLAQLPGRAQDDGLAPVLGAVRADQWGTVFLVDVDWRFVHHPFAQRAGTVGWSYTGVDVPLAEWSRAVEGSGVTVLRAVDRPLNLALRAAYADCVQWEGAGHVLLDGRGCPGRDGALRAALEAQGG